MKNHHKNSYIKPSSPFKAMHAGRWYSTPQNEGLCLLCSNDSTAMHEFFKTFGLRRNERKKSLDIS